MRLHRLEVTAFGPFADPTEVDFDTLSEAGLFLLCGATGAGKTSVLDAVCFAVYGDVPGDRSSARRLRSDLAPEGRAPRVQLELTLAGRRFKITRSPAWTRPKRRGTGTTAEQASVLVEERIAGSWTALTTRMDEAGHLLSGLVGMTMAQFCQVVLLPQGRFQAFLRARSEDRQKLLQQLFSTQRFEQVEQWLRERSRILHRDSQAVQRRVASMVSRVLEASGQVLPEAWSLDALAPIADDGSLAEWAGSLAAAAHQEAATAAEDDRLAAQEEQSRREALDEGRRTAGLHDRRAAALAELAGLEAEATVQDERRTTRQAAARATPVGPLHRLAQAAVRRADSAAAARDTALAALVDVDVDVEAGLDIRLERARASVAEAEALVPVERERLRLVAAIDHGEAEVARLTDDVAELAARADALPAQLRDLRLQVERHREEARELVAQQARTAELATRLEAHDRLVALTAAQAENESRLQASDAECLALKEHWLDLREARLSGMAAEIAAGLAVGDSCPVCGSADHPHKASASPGAPDAAAERAARARLDDAELTRTALRAQAHELATQHATATATAGPGTRADVERDLAALRDLVARLTAAAGALPSREQQLALAEAELAQCSDARVTAGAALAAASTRLDADRAALTEQTTLLMAALDDAGCASVDELLGSARMRAALLERAVTAVDEAARAAEEADRAATALDDCVREAGFDSVADALAAVLEPERLAALEAAVAAYDDRLAAVRAVLAEPEVAAVADAPRPDLAELVATHRAAADRARREHQRATATALRATRVDELAAELTAELAAWEPVRAAHGVASELASFVEGKSPDNRLRMRLSAFVLAWRLSQVVAAANVRLLGMTDQRYALEHTGERGAGETRGGLSLHVRDAWSGESRDPATLSGGETFVVSLALALGLADVVTQEAGGAELDTLFVDEGFGALDPDTLDDVMDTLDTLRDGGRVVGVVSHVTEMRSRIPTRLEVTKEQAGSRLRIERSVG